MSKFSHLCLNCMQPLAEEGAACPHCGDTGEPNAPQFLPTGTVLSERYMVGRLQEAAGDAAIYAGFDTVLKSPIVIREYCPQTLCERGEEGALCAVSGCESEYAEYLAKFLTHARTVARMRDLPASIPTYDIFQQNNTAYTVSERCEGVTLAAYLEEHGGRLSWEEARPLFIPLASSVLSLHKAGVYHFGLTPENLILSEDGKLHISGFSIAEARTANGALAANLSSGYAAPEQYSFGARCGTETDVYGLAAVIFRTLVGVTPPDGEGRPRTNSDLTVPADIAQDLPSHVAAALFHALQPNPEKRIPTIGQLRERLAEAPAVAALLDDEPEIAEVTEPVEEPVEEKAPSSRRGLYTALLIVGFVLLLALLAWLLLGQLFPNRLGGGDEPPASVTTAGQTTGSMSISDPTTAHSPNLEVSVPNLIGRNYGEIRGRVVEDRQVLLDGLRYSDTVPEGQVIEQRPAASEKAHISDPVYVIISAGPERVVVEDVTGWPVDHAMAYLTALGLKVQIDDVPVSKQPAGMVDSCSVGAGGSILRGSTVRLRVSTATTPAPTTTTVPAVTTTPTDAVPPTTTDGAGAPTDVTE